MLRYTGPVPPVPIEYKPERTRLVILCVGVFALTVGVLLVIGVAVIL